MRQRAAEHPSPVKCMRNVHDTGYGKKKRSDAKGIVCVGRTIAKVSTKLSTLRNQQKANPWRTHMSVAHTTKRGRCGYALCKANPVGPNKRQRRRMTCMLCEECTAEDGAIKYFCNGMNRDCHIKHHNKYKCKKQHT